MNRRSFLQVLGCSVAVPSFAAGAEPSGDLAIRARIDAHRPSRLTKLPADFNARVGATHVAGKYHFTTKPFLVEGAEKLIELGTRLGKFWFMPAGGGRDYPFNSTWPKAKDFVELAKTDYWEQVFALPFRTLILEAHSPQGEGFGQERPAPYYDRIVQEFADLTAHFYRKFRERELTIVLQHWEGDWLLRGAGQKWNPPPGDWRRRCERMQRWLAARQAGVAKARAAVSAGARCRVVHAAEVNRVVDAWQNIPTMTTHVLPGVELDLVSYSYYDAMNNPVTLWKAIEEIRRHARTNGPFGARAVFLGEVGIPEHEQGVRIRDRWDEFLGVALALEVPYVVHWELYCNELNPKLKPAPRPPVKNNAEVRGFCLVRPDGSLSESGRYLSELWRRGALRATGRRAWAGLGWRERRGVCCGGAFKCLAMPHRLARSHQVAGAETVVWRPGLQLLGALEGQAAFAFVEPAQAAVAGTAGAADALRGDLVAGLAPGAAAFEPVFPANGPTLGNRRDLVFRVHGQLSRPVSGARAGYDIQAGRQAAGLPPSPLRRGD